MRKSVSCLAAAAVVVACASPAMGTGPVLKCYQLGAFRDQLRLIFEPSINGHQLVYGKWAAPTVYSLAVSGSYETDIDGKTKHLSIVGTTNDPTLFSGNMICGLNGVVGSDLRIQCSGGNGSNVQTSSSPLTSISCPPLDAPPDASDAPAIGLLRPSPQ